MDRGDFVEQQEIEQLSKTLTSLMELYDDCRIQGLLCPNEPEFRAYHIIGRVQDDHIEQQAHDWPEEIFGDQKVQAALKMYASVQSSIIGQSNTEVYQSFPGRFWSVLRSTQMTYLMACLAGTHLALIRGSALNTILASHRTRQKTQDWSLSDLTELLCLSSEDDTRQLCTDHGLNISARDDGQPGLIIEPSNSVLERELC